VRFLVDESLAARATELLEVAGHYGTHVVDIGLAGAADKAVLEAARREV
jgi:predicted nuclease of predicted toxin-antitoxin system